MLNLKEIKKLCKQPNIALHIDNEQELNELCKELTQLGKTWFNGTKYIPDTKWEIFKENTCIILANGSLYSKPWLKQFAKDIKIIEIKELIKKGDNL